MGQSIGVEWSRARFMVRNGKLHFKQYLHMAYIGYGSRIVRQSGQVRSIQLPWSMMNHEPEVTKQLTRKRALPFFSRLSD